MALRFASSTITGFTINIPSGSDPVRIYANHEEKTRGSPREDVDISTRQTAHRRGANPRARIPLFIPSWLATVTDRRSRALATIYFVRIRKRQVRDRMVQDDDDDEITKAKVGRRSR